MLQLIKTRPAPAPNGVMGHVKDTAFVVKVERDYQCQIIGYSAKWTIRNGIYRVQVFDNGVWRGTYPLTKDDIEIY